MQVMVPPHRIYPPGYSLGTQPYRGDPFPPGVLGRWSTVVIFYNNARAGFDNQVM